MTIQQMEYVVAVDTYRHFVKAAESCNVSQSTLSMMIKKVEEELDTPIFDRDSHPIRPTEAGEKIIAQMKVVLFNTEQIKEMSASEKSLRSGDVHLAMIPTVASDLVPQLFLQMQKNCPDIKLHAYELQTCDILDKLRKAELDIAVMATPINSPGTYEIPLYYEKLVGYVSPSDPLYSSQTITSGELPCKRLWTLTSGHCMRDQIFSMCKGASAYTAKYEAGNIDTLVRIVDANGGFTIIPELHLKYLSETQKKNVRQLVNPEVVREISLVIRKDFVRERILNEVASAIKKVIPENMIDSRLKTFAIKLSIILALVFQVPTFASQSNPKANPDATVICGNARFTILTDRLIRMEWAQDTLFEDRASLAIINRDLPVPPFTVQRKGEGLLIKTDKVTLSYSGGRFDASNLSVSFALKGKKVTWHPGDDDSGNLKGTTRTLDGCLGFEKLSKRETELENGLLSRDGWSLIDESRRHLTQENESDWGEWVCERPEGDRIDWYILAYGHDYTAALSDFTRIAGRIPLPPKYTFGYWWSRYWIYTDDELREIGSEMRKRGIPMDVFIIDMDWHLTWKEMDRRKGPDEFGQSRGWTGYTWNRDLITDPDGLLRDLHEMNYKVALNLHPASGIRQYEDCYKAFVKDYLSRTSDYDGPRGYVYGKDPYRFAGVDKACGGQGHLAPVPFRLDQREWADAYFNSVIHPLEKQGVDFWWLDWQQWIESRYVKGLSNTFWCNWAFFNDKVRQSKSQGLDAVRPFIYHRWGGLGSHRYQIGFSGDTYDEWSVMEFLPYFTATASNVGYGYWGHDIGGHMQKKDHQRPTDPEIYTRWLQYGVFTPIFKTHSTQSANLDRRIWSYPTHYEYMKEAIELRYTLSEYIYDAARATYDTGVSMTRPLYYSYPEDDKAYTYNQEFFFGENILATALCQPAGENGLTERKMWFPSGCDWYDMAHHKMRKGGTEQTLYYAISENPWYIKAGAIIPLAPKGIKDLQHSRNSWRILIAPGSGKSSYTHYEDDGLSQRYVDEYATTLIRKSATSSGVTVIVEPREGTFAGAPSTRKLSLVLEGFNAAPRTVKVGGIEAQASLEGSAVVIDLPELPVDETITVEVRK